MSELSATAVAPTAQCVAAPANDMTYSGQGFRLRLRVNVADANGLFTVMYIGLRRRPEVIKRSNWNWAW